MDKALRLARDLIHQWEQYREFAYPDPASPLAKATPGKRWGYIEAPSILATLDYPTAFLSGHPWTVGYGSTGRYIGPTTRWSPEVAAANSEAAIEDIQEKVRKLIPVHLAPHQEAALISLCYNIGVNAFTDSTLLRLLRSGDIDGAAEQFKRWNKARGKVLTGLSRRRAAEAAMFRGTAPASSG